MITKAILLGVILSVIGILSYILSNAQSVTALIPTFIGLPILILGITARDERWHRHAMHGTLIFALFGFLGSVLGIPKLLIWVFGGDIVRPFAVIVQSVMSVLCAVYLFYAIRSFLEARKQEND